MRQFLQAEVGCSLSRAALHVAKQCSSAGKAYSVFPCAHHLLQLHYSFISDQMCSHACIHCPPLQNVMAKLVIARVPSVEMIRFVSSGTEACLSVLRLMRAFTKREKLIKFVGCYHGHADSFLVKAGSGVATLGLPDSPGKHFHQPMQAGQSASMSGARHQ